MWNTFIMKQAVYNLRKGTELDIGRTTGAINSFDFRASLAGNNLFHYIKNIKDLQNFKSAITKIRIYCNCRNC